MRISVIIPVLNEAENVARAIASVELAHEVICVDGGSTDGSIEAIEQTGVSLLQSEQGRGVQLNAGAAVASGDVLLFLHGDNWLAHGSLEQLRDACSQKQLELGGFQQRIEAEGSVYRWLERGNAFRVKSCGLVYGDQGLWIRRKLFEEIGGFKPIPLMEEVELLRRARRVASPVLLPGPIHVSARRWQQHGIVSQTIRNWSLLTAYRCGVSPEKLAGYYRPPASKSR